MHDAVDKDTLFANEKINGQDATGLDISNCLFGCHVGSNVHTDCDHLQARRVRGREKALLIYLKTQYRLQGMPTSIEQIQSFLDSEELSYAVSHSGTSVYVPFAGATVRVIVVEDGEGVVFAVRNVFNLRDCPYRCVALEWMARHVANAKIGHFGYDPEDGEVDVSHFQPVEDGELAESVFLRCLYVVNEVATSSAQELRRVAFTGVMPANSDDGNDTSAPQADSGQTSDGAGHGCQPGQEGSWGGQIPCELPKEFDLQGMAAHPVAETVWIGLVFDAFAAQMTEPPVASRLVRMRSEVWPKLQALREQSVASGQAYRTLEVERSYSLDADEGFVLGYLAYLTHSKGTQEHSQSSLEALFPCEQQQTATTALAKLCQKGLLQRQQPGGNVVYRPGHAVLVAYGADRPIERRSRGHFATPRRVLPRRRR